MKRNVTKCNQIISPIVHKELFLKKEVRWIVCKLCTDAGKFTILIGLREEPLSRFSSLDARLKALQKAKVIFRNNVFFMLR